MTTVIQDLIADLDKIKKHLTQKTEIQTIQLIIDTAKNKYLIKEKEQLKQSFDCSEKEMHNSFSNDYYKKKSFDNFYQETFSNKVE